MVSVSYTHLKQVDGGYGTLVGAVIVYVALLDYKYESNPKTCLLYTSSMGTRS